MPPSFFAQVRIRRAGAELSALEDMYVGLLGMMDHIAKTVQNTEDKNWLGDQQIEDQVWFLK